MGNNINGKLIAGCRSPQDQEQKQIYARLAQIFAPVVHFDPEERFFPVDLPSTIAASALYRLMYQNQKARKEKETGNITSNDLETAGSNFFTTVGDWKIITKVIDNQNYYYPIPDLEEVYKKYTSGEAAIPAKLTMYASFCKLTDVPNYHFLEQFPPALNTIVDALAEGSALLLNYYFYFPAAESFEIKREGDWSGISLLFLEKPNLDDLVKGKWGKSQPVLTCYFKKIGDFLTVGDDGFRMWNQLPVEPIKDKTTGLKTHPVVYISQGRHNCYYKPVKDRRIPTYVSGWGIRPDPNKIERGDYSPSPASTDNTILGNGVHDWEDFFLFSYFKAMANLLTCGTGCTEFDRSGLPPRDAYDTINPGGYECDPESAETKIPPTSDNYPPKLPNKGGAAPLNLKLNVVYVDLDDPGIKADWQYQGSWGAAEQTKFTYRLSDGKRHVSSWAEYGGFERPNLAPWFLWNLYSDPLFGSGGGSGYRIPGP